MPSISYTKVGSPGNVMPIPGLALTWLRMWQKVRHCVVDAPQATAGHAYCTAGCSRAFWAEVHAEHACGAHRPQDVPWQHTVAQTLIKRGHFLALLSMAALNLSRTKKACLSLLHCGQGTRDTRWLSYQQAERRQRKGKGQPGRQGLQTSSWTCVTTTAKYKD